MFQAPIGNLAFANRRVEKENPTIQKPRATNSISGKTARKALDDVTNSNVLQNRTVPLQKTIPKEKSQRVKKLVVVEPPEQAHRAQYSDMNRDFIDFPLKALVKPTTRLPPANLRTSTNFEVFVEDEEFDEKSFIDSIKIESFERDNFVEDIPSLPDANFDVEIPEPF